MEPTPQGQHCVGNLGKKEEAWPAFSRTSPSPEGGKPGRMFSSIFQLKK